jgi:hypothetical protein
VFTNIERFLFVLLGRPGGLPEMKQHVQINAFIKKGKKGRTWNAKENLKNM